MEKVGRYFDTESNIIYVGTQNGWMQEYPQKKE
jgi:hypothetical protein